MAKNVTGQVLGGRDQVFNDVRTVSDVARKLSIGEKFKATINGEPAVYGDTLQDFAFVSFSESVKGGSK